MLLHTAPKAPDVMARPNGLVGEARTTESAQYDRFARMLRWMTAES